VDKLSKNKESVLSLEDLFKLLEKYGEIELSNVTIHIDKLTIRGEKQIARK